MLLLAKKVTVGEIQRAAMKGACETIRQALWCSCKVSPRHRPSVRPTVPSSTQLRPCALTLAMAALVQVASWYDNRTPTLLRWSRHQVLREVRCLSSSYIDALKRSRSICRDRLLLLKRI